jgi:uncharacterized protein (DUF488 family)
MGGTAEPNAETRIYSIGHSNRSLEELIDLLSRHGVGVLVDVRRFPGSRRLPQFNRTALEAGLARAGLGYEWGEALGGRRNEEARSDSPNHGLTNAGFRAYADYMLTDRFRDAVDRLIERARERPAAMMCAEAVYWRCHRRLISDHLLARGITVQHILSPTDVRPHRPTPVARIENECVIYPASLFDTSEPTSES